MNILGVGIATLDIINTVAGFPAENDEVRALSRTQVRGGNVTNTLVVLSQLQHHCFWAGTLDAGKDSDRILEDLTAYRVDCRYHVKHAQGSLPTSYITLNRNNGSRTIVHYRDLEEFSFRDFQAIAVNDFHWIHFEGRNVEQTGQMLQSLKDGQFAGRVSLEIEKPRQNIEQLLPLADLLLFSRHFAQSMGYGDGADFLRQMREAWRLEHDMVCAWGETGAYALGADGSPCFAPAWQPANIVDTLGAGDTFNAGMINGLAGGRSLCEALQDACLLAGTKCGQSGFDGLGNIWNAEHE